MWGGVGAADLLLHHSLISNDPSQCWKGRWAGDTHSFHLHTSALLSTCFLAAASCAAVYDVYLYFRGHTDYICVLLVPFVRLDLSVPFPGPLETLPSLPEGQSDQPVQPVQLTQQVLCGLKNNQTFLQETDHLCMRVQHIYMYSTCLWLSTCIRVHNHTCEFVEPKLWLRADLRDSSSKQRPCPWPMSVHLFCACLDVWSQIKLLLVYMDLKGWRVHVLAPLCQRDYSKLFFLRRKYD